MSLIWSLGLSAQRSHSYALSSVALLDQSATENGAQRNCKCQAVSIHHLKISSTEPPKGARLRYKCDSNPPVCVCVFLCVVSFPEWTHLLLSGPHVPLVPADLKAPVQCSPCKKNKNNNKKQTKKNYTRKKKHT